MFEKLERLSSTATKLSEALSKIPRAAEMLGVAMFAARASERVGGKAVDGAIGGIVADGLAHSELANNFIFGTALGAYFTTIGLINILPFGPPVIADPEANITGAGGTTLDPKNVYDGLAPNEKVVTIQECYQAGGTVQRVIPQTALCVCALPPPPPLPPHEGGGSDRPIRPNRPVR